MAFTLKRGLGEVGLDGGEQASLIDRRDRAATRGRRLRQYPVDGAE